MKQVKLLKHEKFTCFLCFAVCYGEKEKCAHMREKHGAKPGWKNNGYSTRTSAKGFGNTKNAGRAAR
ncbi:MAG: hypothetical protein ACPGYT_11770 [Nitrospirales bacterium]